MASGLIFEEVTHHCSSPLIGLNAASGAYLLAREPGKCQLPVGQSNVYLKLGSAITKENGHWGQVADCHNLFLVWLPVWFCRLLSDGSIKYQVLNALLLNSEFNARNHKTITK